MSEAITAERQSIVLVGRASGLSIIPQPTPLTRLRFFDGKFLRAADLELEQRYHRELVAQSNRAGGSGVVHGFDCTLAGDALSVGAGLAIDPEGRVLLLPEERRLSLSALIEASRARPGQPAPRPLSATRLSSANRLAAAGFADCVEAAADDSAAVAEGTTLHLLVAFHAEALCGEEDVYGKLCEEACVTSTERPYVVEGVVVRAVPLDLVTPLPTSTAVALTRAHLRSRVASAFFEDERRAVASLISRQGLDSEAWCRGALAAAGSGVPLGLLARAGTDTLFLDAWIARRERIEPPPRRFWARAMAMRPWDVFLAQVLQFQCQLREALDAAADPGGGDDPCAEAHRLLADASAGIERVLLGVAEERAAGGGAVREVALLAADRRAADRPAGGGESARAAAGAAAGRAVAPANIAEAAGGGRLELAAAAPAIRHLDAIRSQLAAAAEAFFAPATERLLLAGGIVELPAAGYLPVVPESNVGVERQVRRMVGEGLDLRFCAVRPDFVPHALEEAQHMERISLTAGLDDPEARPRVDVLVPDGVFEEVTVVSPGTGYRTTLAVERLALLLFDELLPDRPLPVAGFDPRRLSPIARTADLPPVAMSGAGRGEELPGGGWAFHFAGRTPPARNAVVRPGFEPRPIEGPARPFDVGGLTPRPFADRAAAGPATAGRVEDFERRLASLSAVERLRAADPLAAAAAGFNVFGVDQDAGAVWVTVRTAADPFALPVNAATQVTADLLLLYPTAAPRTLRRLQFSGDLIVLGRRTSGDNTILDVRLLGVGTVRTVEVDAGGTTDRTLRIDEESIRLERGAGDRAKVKVLAPARELWPQPNNPIELEIERAWPAADRAEVVGAAKVATSEDKTPLFDSSQVVDPAVLVPANASHDAALAALGALGSALGDPRFADDAARVLFPPAAPSTDTTTIRATRDWVLFHRRRDKDCGVRAEPAVEVAPRRYRLFHVGLADASEIAVLGSALGAAGTVPGFKPVLVGTVDFAPGIQALQTPHDEVRTAWSARVPAAAEIVYGGIASRGVALDEGEPLAAARLAALTSLLGPFDEDAGGGLETLAAIPGALPAGDADGLIVVATVAVQTACHEVYRGVLDEEAEGALIQTLSGTALAPVFRRLGLQRLGAAGFRAGTAEPFGPGTADLPGLWKRAGGGAPAAALAVTRAGAERVEADLADAQAARIAAAVAPAADAAGQSAPVRTVPSVEEALEPCPGITVLVVRPAPERTCHEVVVTKATVASGLESLVAQIGQGALTGEVLAGQQFLRLGAVRFDAGSADPERDSLDAVMAGWRAATGSGAPPRGFTLRGLAVAPPDANGAVPSLVVDQTARVLAALGGSPEAIPAAHRGERFPVDCGALTLVVPVATGSRDVLPVVINRSGGGFDPRVVLAPRFDEAGEVIRDEAFEREVAALREAGTRFVRLSLAAPERPEGTDPRLASLHAALEEAGVVTGEARRTTRTLKDDDRRTLEKRLGAAVPGVLILEAA